MKELASMVAWRFGDGEGVSPASFEDSFTCFISFLSIITSCKVDFGHFMVTFYQRILLFLLMSNC